MQLKPLAFAATAAAFVIVPEISEADDTIFRALPVQDAAPVLPAHAFAQELSVPCPQCRGKDRFLKLGLDIKDGTALLLNGFELYPNASPWHGDMLAVVAGGEGDEKEQKLGYSLSVEPVAVDKDQQMQLIDVQLRVIEVGSQFVEGVPVVKVQLIKALTGEIMLGSVALQNPSDTRCLTMFCHAKGVAEDVLTTLRNFRGKGCIGSKYRHMSHDPTHGERPHHPSVKHLMMQHRQHWRHLLRNLVSHVVVPVLTGVTAGIGVAMLSVLLCSIVVRFARLFRGRKTARGGGCCRQQKSAQPAEAVDEEKAALMEPVYDEAPPQYQDTETKNQLE